MMDLNNGLVIALISVGATQLLSVFVTIYFARGRTITKLNETMIKLSTQMEIVLKAIEDLPKYKRDTDHLFDKVREFQNGKTR